MYGIVIEGKDIEGNPKDRTPSEILPVFKYLKEHENYMPILMNMILDMIGCYKFPDLRHEADYMKSRREYLIDGALKTMFGDIKAVDENKYYALETNYYMFKEACIIASGDALLRGNKQLHGYFMNTYDAASFGYQNEDTERNKRIVYEHEMQFVPYLRYFVANHLSDNNISRTVRLGACFWKVAAFVWPELFPEHDKSIERFMNEGRLPEILPVLKNSSELMRVGQLPIVLETIYSTLEDYFKYLCPQAVSPRPPAQETVIFRQKRSK